MVKSKLKEVMDEKGLSIRKVASATGYRFETVRRMYNNDMKCYPRDLIDCLCAYLGVAVGDILEYEKGPH